ncbi:cation/multidrug efflux pump [Bernardetia litoralis DSM 6794]|uniref:Cation/multidrug efflux pump n=1 Tax=Bernardetia litoralis (strain ATCC 23117 / DSM 6794 / NBRC 15988 / NCIMB 1366 / Fx l1 / Sio-4) TaxID=880071 RepID=I4AN24_BERLS|nr:efflux RND transporter permease subunit [Bernardetia litoralis]AFM05359.1 cation/multidrug efflux pump [Bernardetia litoralis DSM 6794]
MSEKKPDLNKKEKPLQDPKIEIFGLSKFSIKNSTSIFIITILFVVAGIFSYIIMPKEQYPEIVMAKVYVQTIYPGNSPVDIENLITRPIEKELKSLKGVKDISSTSVQDASAIIVEFNEDVEVDEAVTDVKDAVDKAKKELPKDLDQDPTIMEVDLSEIPIMEINLSGDFEQAKLKEYAEYLQDELEELSQVSEAIITGDRDREVQINADIYKMAARKISFQDIENAVLSENLTASGGDVLTEGHRRSLRVVGEFKNVEQLNGIIVKSENNQPIYLNEVAEVKDSYVERSSYARLATGNNFESKGSSPVISLKVKKRSGENLIDAAYDIKEVLKKAQGSNFPSSLDITIVNDQSENMEMQIANLQNNIISGVILVVVALLFFMGLRNALLVGIAIPLSMLISFMVLNLLGISINMVVLFALILALGMLVDNAIVVIENTYRFIEEGYPAKKAAVMGVSEVAWPIISSTATTLAAFVPLAFWGGIMGEFLKYMPITLIIVLTSSLFVGLVINPVFSAFFMKAEAIDKKGIKTWLIVGIVSMVLAALGYGYILATGASNYTLPNILTTFGSIIFLNIYFLTPASDWFQNKLLVRLERIYMRTLRYLLKGARPYFLTAGMFFLLVFSFVLVGSAGLQTSLFPNSDPLFVYMYVEAPLGTDIKTTNEFAEEVEKKAYKTLAPYDEIIKSIGVNVGEESGDPQDNFGGSGATPHKARIAVAFYEFQYRKGLSTSDIMKELSAEMKTIPGVKIKTDKNREGPPVGKPVNIEISGVEYDVLVKEAEKVKKMIEDAGIQGLDNLVVEAETGKPELILTIDREKARLFGLSTSQVALTLRTAIFGKEISKYKDGDDDFPIQLRLQDKYRYNLSALMNQVITFRDSRGAYHQVPISSIAKVDYSSSYGSVRRKDLDRMVAVSSGIVEGYNANEIVSQIKLLIKSHKLPEDYSMKLTGEQEEQAKSMAFLAKAMLIAVSAITLILVSQFNSIVKPFIIMGSVLFSMTGVMLGLVIFQMDFIIIMTGIGIISLAGVVVNNAIVLIDYTDQVRANRKEELGLSEEEHLPAKEFLECVVKAGYTRLRPVLLTAITTVLGLIPLATGMNIDFAKLYANFNPDFYMGGDNATFWGPMAWAVIFGLAFATFLTLVVVPAMYLMADQFSEFVNPSPKSTVIAERKED